MFKSNMVKNYRNMRELNLNWGVMKNARKSENFNKTTVR